MKHMKFNENFNKKLDCNYFTTFRFSNKWKVSDDIIIMCKNEFIFDKILQVKAVRMY